MNIKLLCANNIKHNFFYAKVKSQKEIIAVVKANAYGHGLNEFVKAMDYCNYFASNSVLDCLQIKKMRQDAKVLCFGEPTNIKTANKNGVVFSAFCLQHLQQIEKSCVLPQKVHIKINSGMNRFGISKIEDLQSMLAFIDQSNFLVLDGIFTHLFSNAKKHTNKQLLFFNKFVALAKENCKNIDVHIGGSKSISIKNNEATHLRVGLALYGYGAKQLQPAMKIFAKVQQINNVAKKQFVGYDKAYKTKIKCKIAVCSLGYADGLYLPNAKKMLIKFNGQKAKVVSKICMDCFFIKIKNKNNNNCGFVQIENHNKNNKTKLQNRNGTQNLMVEICNIKKLAKIQKCSIYHTLCKFSKFRGKTIVK